ncbi:MAG: RNA methyltransferase, partial [Muribaculaceae bacterium]|nr:RNA methyltransferase [Muribaculaceae bacterium]
PLSAWESAPAGGVLITNPPYGERLRPADLEGLYDLLGNKLKHVFTGYHAWVIGYRDEDLMHIGLRPSSRDTLLNGSLQCELREYIIFDGDRASFRAAGGSTESRRTDRPTFRKERRFEDRKERKFDRKFDRGDRKPFGGKRRFDRDERPERPQEPESENPLAKRRNPKALEAIIGRQPKISRRKGWRGGETGE